MHARDRQREEERRFCSGYPFSRIVDIVVEQLRLQQTTPNGNFRQNTLK